jgi:hypothetical protein
MDEEDAGGGVTKSPIRRLGSTRKLLTFNSKWLNVCTLLISTAKVCVYYCNNMETIHNNYNTRNSFNYYVLFSNAYKCTDCNCKFFFGVVYEKFLVLF